MGSLPAKAPDPAKVRLLGLRIMVLGLLVVLFMLPRAWDKLAARRWPAVEATVIFSDIVERTGKTHDWCVRVGYRYSVDGGRQGGAKRWACSASRAGAEAKLAQMQPGQRIEAYYNPAHPERSVLEPDALDAIDIFIGALALTLFAVGFDRIRHARRLAATA